MKALHCLDCDDLVVPFTNGSPRGCICRRHVIWSTKARAATVAALDRKGTRDRAHLFRISNALLKYSGETTGPVIKKLLQTPMDVTHFKDQHSLIIQTKIGAHSDSVWADSLPTGPLLSEAPVGRRALLARLAGALFGA